MFEYLAVIHADMLLSTVDLLPGGVTYVSGHESVRPLPMVAAGHECRSCGAPADGRWRCSYCLTVRT